MPIDSFPNSQVSLWHVVTDEHVSLTQYIGGAKTAKLTKTSFLSKIENQSKANSTFETNKYKCSI